MSYRALLRILLLRECEPVTAAGGTLLAIGTAVLFVSIGPAPDDPLGRALARLLGSFEGPAAVAVTCGAMVAGIERAASDRSAAWLVPLRARAHAAGAYPVLLGAAIGVAGVVLYAVALAAWTALARSVAVWSIAAVAATGLRAYAAAVFAVLLAGIVRSRAIAHAILLLAAFGPLVGIASQLMASPPPETSWFMRILMGLPPASSLGMAAGDVVGAAVQALLFSAVALVAWPVLDRGVR